MSELQVLSQVGGQRACLRRWPGVSGTASAGWSVLWSSQAWGEEGSDRDMHPGIYPREARTPVSSLNANLLSLECERGLTREKPGKIIFSPNHPNHFLFMKASQFSFWKIKLYMNRIAYEGQWIYYLIMLYTRIKTAWENGVFRPSWMNVTWSNGLLPAYMAQCNKTVYLLWSQYIVYKTIYTAVFIPCTLLVAQRLCIFLSSSFLWAFTSCILELS